MSDHDDDEEVPAGAPQEHDEGYGDAEASRITSITELNAKVERLFEMIRSGTRPAAEGAAAPDVASQVRAEVGKLRQAERAKGRNDRLTALEQSIKKLTEKAPVEYRKVTRFMWGDPADDAHG